MAASVTPCLANRGMALCSWTSCPLQKGHQSAERKKRRTVPFAPLRDSSVCTRPNWSRAENGGACWPVARPMDIGVTDATWIVSVRSVPRTVTASPRCACTDSWGSRLYITRSVSSYSASWAPGMSLVQSGDSAKASSALQLLETRMPDQAPDFVATFCAAGARDVRKRRAQKRKKRVVENLGGSAGIDAELGLPFPG